MLGQYDFAVTQLRYIKAAMDQIASFRPDGLAPADVTTEINAAAPIRTTYVAEVQDIGDARTARRLAVEALHEGCVSFTGQALNHFRKEPRIVERLEKLPHTDLSFQDTLTRADSIIAYWPKLPLVGTPPAQWKYGEGTEEVTLADFTALRDDAKTKDAELPGIDQDFQDAEAQVHAKLAAMQDFAESAISLGRDRYDVGSPEREIIEAIPSVAPAAVPGPGEIQGISAEAPGTVRFTMAGERATSFDVLRRIAEGGGEYETIAEDVIEKDFVDTGLAPGTAYQYMVRPRNSRGAGPLSEASTITVPEAP